MDFNTALYNCVTRRLELAAFGQDELHTYWKESLEYSLAMNTGIDASNYIILQDTRDKKLNNNYSNFAIHFFLKRDYIIVFFAAN